MKRFRTTLTVLAALLTTALLYLAVRIGLAAYFMHQANKKSRQEEPIASYELQKKALNLNPLFANYQRRYALTNLSLATALTNKTELTSEEQAKLPELVKQSVRAAKQATQLQPQNPLNWQILGQIYANLLAVVPQADQFAIEAYLKAIELDETNPNLKLNLGKIFFQKNQFPQAQKLFESAISLQPNLSEAYYYLAQSQTKQKQFKAALQNYEKLLSLIEPGTDNFMIIEEELEVVQNELRNSENDSENNN